VFRFTAHIVQTSLSHADPGSRDGTCVALYSNYLSGRPNNSRHQHRYVSDPRAKIQDTLTSANACSTEESFGNRSETCSLSDEAFLLRVGIT